MYKPILFFLSFLILFSCNTKQENKTTNKATTQDTLAPLQVTVIADLHDTLQPKTIALDTMPKPKVIQAGLGETKTLAVLQNEKGKPILDPAGNTFISNDGGKANFTNFTTENGLVLDAIICSAMDKTGNLWFGTAGGGLSRYDGKSFTSFTTAQGLASNIVYCITEDKTGNLWFGTVGGGVSRYDGKSFTNFTTTEGLADNSVFNITEDNTGNLWFGTQGGGVSSYNGKTFTNFTTAQGLAGNQVRSSIKDKTGNLWFGTADGGGGVSRYDGKTFTSFTTAQGLPNYGIIGMAEDKAGNIWFGTWGGGVSRYDGITFTNFTTADGLAHNKVRSITEDKTGNLWFGTLGGGVSRYDGKTFTSFTTAQGLANNVVRSITEDKAGNLWFGTDGGGVSRYDGKAFNSFTTAQGLADNVIFAITEDKTGTLWFKTFGNLISCYNGKTFTNFKIPHVSFNEFKSITEDKTGNLWFGTSDRGLIRYDGKTFTNFSTDQGLVDNYINLITEDKAGNLWVGTYGGGVSRYDGKTFTNYTTGQGLANNDIRDIIEDKAGNLWFATYGGGVSRFDGKTFINYTSAHGLSDNSVFCITEDKAGNLWFGTDDGLSLLKVELLEQKSAEDKRNPNSNRDTSKGVVSEKLFKSFKIKDGLPDNLVTQVIQMPNGKMAVGTNLGITLFNLSEDDTKLTDIEIYNTNTGFPVSDVNAGKHCMLLDSKGIIWAGTGSEKTALVRFDYAALNKNTKSPTVVIQSVKVKDENICWYNLQSRGILKNLEDSSTALLQEVLAYGKTLSITENDSILKRFGSIQFDGITKFYPLPQNLVLPYEHNQITFEFAAIETDRPFLVKYQYMLEGYDKDWSPVTGKSNANFGNINEGTYTFKLKAQGANGVWCKPITYTFQVLPPWYRTWWAYLIYALLFLLVLRLFVKWRERTLLAEKVKLEKTVEIRTAEVVAEKKEVEKQKKRSDDLLLNILPEEVAEELKAKGSADAKQFDEVTVMFTDFKGFTQISEKLTPSELVAEIHTCFKAFDNIITKYNIEKIKTIGDSYMCAGGLPVANKSHADDVVSAALEIQKFMHEHLQQRKNEGKEPFEIRIGVHTGPVVAGIVGVKKFAYDIWGDTVNIASRMESSGEAGKVNISGSTYELIKDMFKCEHRGKIQAKNKGEIDMYFVSRNFGES